MPAMTEYRYNIIPSAELTDGQHTDIGRLLFRYMKSTYPRVPAEEISTFCDGSAVARSNPNLTVARRGFRDHQKYARSVCVVAVNNDSEIAAAVTVADNSSSSLYEMLPGTAGKVVERAELFAKLRIPFGSLKGKPLIRSRHVWHGQPAYTDYVRGQLQDVAEDEFDIFSGLIYAGSLRRNRAQPLSAYTFYEEDQWKAGLEKNDFHTNVSDDETAHPFGTSLSTIVQTWRADSIENTHQKIKNLIGADVAIAGIRRTVLGLS